MARLEADPGLPVAGVEHDRQPPGLDVAERRHLRQARAPVGRNVDMIHRAAKAVRLVEAHQAVGQRLAGQLLDLRVERGAHRQAAFIQFLLAVEFEQFASNLLGEITRHISVRRQHARVDAELLRLGLGAVGGRNEAVGDHAVDHVVAALDGAVAVREGMIVVRPLRQRGEIGHLGDGQLVDRFVEIVERGGADAVVAKAKIDFVEIELEDALLRIGRLDAERNQRLADLALDRALVADEEVLGHLLGDRRGALHVAAALDDDIKARPTPSGSMPLWV